MYFFIIPSSSNLIPETGEAEVRCPIELDGDPMSIGFNPSFLTDVVRVIDSNNGLLEGSPNNDGPDLLVVEAGANRVPPRASNQDEPAVIAIRFGSDLSARNRSPLTRPIAIPGRWFSRRCATRPTGSET